MLLIVQEAIAVELKSAESFNEQMNQFHRAVAPNESTIR